MKKKRETMNVYNFQLSFLKPFEYIMAQTRQGYTQQLVAEYLYMIIDSVGVEIKSGWKSILFVLSMYAKTEVIKRNSNR